MPKPPAYQFYPKDCDTDEKVRAQDDREFGFFVRCLNHSWLNDGLPADLPELARVMSRNLPYLKKLWVRVGPCFVKLDGRLFNPKQEEYRATLGGKSEAAKAAANIRWNRIRQMRTHVFEDASASIPHRSGDALHTMQCADADEDSKKLSVVFEKPRVLTGPEKASMRDGLAAFQERWGALTKRSQSKQAAGVAWFAVVVPETIDVVLACLERYGASDEVARGVVMNPDKWLYVQARDDWTGTWPTARASPKSKTATIYRDGSNPSVNPKTPVDWKADTETMDRPEAEFLLARDDIPGEQRESILTRWPDLRQA